MKAKSLAANAALVVSIIAPVLIAPAGTSHGITLMTVAVACLVIFSILAAVLLAASIEVRNISALVISTEKKSGSAEAALILLKQLKVLPRAFLFVPSDAKWSSITCLQGATVRAALEVHKQSSYFWACVGCLFAFVLASTGEIGIALTKFSSIYGGTVFISWALQVIASYAATSLLFLGVFIQLALIFSRSK